jgi:flagellar M-ring protein FliF
MDGIDKNDIMRFAELGVLAVVALLILLFAVRPFLKSLMSPPPTPLGLALNAPQVTRMVTLSDGSTQEVRRRPDRARPSRCPVRTAMGDMDQRIDIAKIEGQVKASSIKQVSEFVEKHPEESVSILRSWLHESE